MLFETRSCQNCRSDFRIEPEDFQFYEKIKVPPPTWCPECRFQRRLVFYNAIRLFRRKCDLCGKESISSFHPDAPYVVYCPNCWWSDKWDAKEYARDYDFSRPFFEQVNELWHTVPLLALSNSADSIATSPYTHHVSHLKNCYLLFDANEVEDSSYGFYVGTSKSLVDCTAIVQSELCYDGMHSYKTNRCIGARHQLAYALDCIFCRDCENCQNCFGCANLYKKKYHIFNRPYTKEAYFEELKNYDLGSYRGYRAAQRKAEEFWKTQLAKSEYNEFVENCTGPNVFFSKSVKDSIEVQRAEDSRWLFLMWAGNTKNCYDISAWGENLSDSYEGCVVGENSSQLRFCQESGIGLLDAEYSKLSTSSSHNFGCVSIRKGEYFILNKKYSKEKYQELRGQIIQHMNEMPYVDNRGNTYRYGEFFPPEISPFAYNESLARYFFPLDKAEALSKKYAWRDVEPAHDQATISADQLPDHIKDATDDALRQVIACPTCPRAYRIAKMELDLLRHMNVPLPRRCPMCRIEEKLNLWVKNQGRIPRTCPQCGVAFESKYAEEEVPRALCQKCYYAEVK